MKTTTMKTTATITAATEPAPKLTGFRVWFDNCGDEPRFSTLLEEGVDYNDFRPWTAEDDDELAEWQDYDAHRATS